MTAAGGGYARWYSRQESVMGSKRYRQDSDADWQVWHQGTPNRYLYSDLSLNGHPGLSHTPCGVKVGVDRLDTWKNPRMQALSLVRCGGSEMPPNRLAVENRKTHPLRPRRVSQHFHPVPPVDTCGKARIWRRVERRRYQLTRRLTRVSRQPISDFTSVY